MSKAEMAAREIEKVLRKYNVELRAAGFSGRAVFTVNKDNKKEYKEVLTNG